ncbi:MAG TPA: GtrA family protein [Rhizomicrobium sp.]|nr:GtrA family protein [Rhizomicrobium sp.]
MTPLLLKLSQSRFVRFAAVGGAGFFVNEAALLLAHGALHAGPSASWFIAFAPSVTFTWWGNRTITFADQASTHHAGILAEWARFVLTNSLGAAANFVVYLSLIRLAPWPLDVPYIALAVGILVGLVFNFTLSKRLVFRN